MYKQIFVVLTSILISNSFANVSVKVESNSSKQTIVVDTGGVNVRVQIDLESDEYNSSRSYSKGVSVNINPDNI